MMAPVAMIELAATLQTLAPTMQRLSELLVAQRQGVADGNLQHILALTVEQEETSARLAHLERRRQKIQTTLERELGVQGLTSVVAASGAPDEERERLAGLVDELRRQVVRLHRENERSAQLLSAAIEVAHRTRANLARLSGAEPAYPNRRPLRPIPHTTMAPAPSGS